MSDEPSHGFGDPIGSNDMPEWAEDLLKANERRMTELWRQENWDGSTPTHLASIDDHEAFRPAVRKPSGDASTTCRGRIGAPARRLVWRAVDTDDHALVLRVDGVLHALKDIARDLGAAL